MAKSNDRSWLLERLRDLAAGPICREAVAARLDMTEAEFELLCEKDAEIRRVWEHGRHVFFMASKRAIMAGAEAGKAHCLRTLELIVRAEAGATEVSDAPERIDFRRLSPKQMSEAVGIDHRQLNRWSKEHGLPRGPDGCYSLREFVRWLRHADVGRVRPYRRRPGAVEKRLVARVQAVIHEEMSGHTEPGGGQNDE